MRLGVYAFLETVSGGYWVVKRKTGRGQLTRALKKISKWCRENCHRLIADQHRSSAKKLRGALSLLGNHLKRIGAIGISV